MMSISGMVYDHDRVVSATFPKDWPKFFERKRESGYNPCTVRIYPLLPVRAPA